MINNMLDLLLCSMANYQMDVSVLPKTLVELIRLILPPFQTLLNEPSSFLVGILHGSKSFFLW